MNSHSTRHSMAGEDNQLRCPTCGAAQVPSEQCRRCKCDLSLVTAVHRQQQSLEVATLVRLRDGRYEEAVQTARQRCSLAPDRKAVRLLAVCYVLSGRFRAALDTYRQLQ